MSFDAPGDAPGAPRRHIAVIGAGISGLSAARLLAPQHQVTLYEAAPRLGGHARTVMAGLRGDQPVDTGFIVFNYANYPHLTRMFADLDVPVIKSDMTFAASINGGAVEYGLRDLGSVFGQRRNLIRPQFLRMLRDIDRFNRRAVDAASSDDITIADLTRQLGLGEWFERYYLMPICGAIWSTPADEVGSFPARSLVRFFSNHALMSARGQHQWWTVDGGSIQYVQRLERDLAVRGVDIRPATPVQAVTRDQGKVRIKSMGSPAETYDQVIFACHSDAALRLLQDPSADETAALSAIRFQDNRAVLHRDPLQMPRRKRCWSSWNYMSDGKATGAAVGVTYWMNRLQNIPAEDPLYLTLNPSTPIADALIYDETTFRHPVFDGAALAAQKVVSKMQGLNATWYAGAYLRHGFHEDGFASSVRVARQLDPVFA